jgi:hypothetical protein
MHEHLEPEAFVLDEDDQADWSQLCRQADLAVRRAVRRPSRAPRRKPSRRATTLCWIVEQVAGSLVGSAAFVLTWLVLGDTVESGHVRGVLSAAPALAAWVLVVLLIRWAPRNKLAFLLDR